MTGIQRILKRTSLVAVAFVMFASWLAVDVLIFAADASAAQITARSLALSSSANGNITVGTAGSGTNGAQTRHTFNFTEGTPAATVGSIEFLYCTTPLPGTACVAPTGMDASTVTSIGGTTNAGWTLGTGGNVPTANMVRITRTPSDITNTQNLILGAGGTGTDYIKNPTTDNEDFFVRITTYATNAWGTQVDTGTVANSTAQQIDITAKVQETLNFSVGAPDVGSVPAPGAGCTPFSDDGAMTLGDATDGVLSFLQAYDAYSFFRVSTNANDGAIIYYAGDTLKNGAEDIAQNGATAVASAVGTEQFGLAIDTTQAAHSFGQLSPTAEYAEGDGAITNAGDAEFAFEAASLTTPVAIANSGSSTITCDTGAVRYIGNISTTTPPGIYTTTLSYIATPTY